MRIGIVCYPTFGGSGVIASEIGHSLAARGHDIHFVTSEKPARVDLSQPRVHFHKVEVKDYPLLDHSPYALALASKLVEITRTEKLDLIHVHYAIPHAASAYLARQILGARAPKLVTTLHGTDITLVGNDPSFWPITRFSMLASDLLTVPSRFLGDATRTNFELPAAPIEVIPNFVDTDRFRPIEAQHRTLVHSSNFRGVKRVDDVVRIFARVAAVRDDVELVLVGDGPERPAIDQQVRDLGLTRVRFIGAVHDVASSLQGAALFLMPSASESFGLAALEAQSCGVPVIATKVGGVAEVIVDGETGLLSALGDVEKMAEDALALLSNESRRAQMGRAARDQAVRLFRREPIVDRYEAAYASLA